MPGLIANSRPVLLTCGAMVCLAAFAFVPFDPAGPAPDRGQWTLLAILMAVTFVVRVARADRPGPR